MKDFRKISDLLQPPLPATGDSPAPEAAQCLLREIWRQSAGKPALHSQTLLFRSGRVAVFAESPLWASELRHRTPSLLQALRQGGLKVHRLDIRVQPTASQAKVKPRRKPQLSAQSAHTLRVAAGQVTHPELREALKKLARMGPQEKR